MRDHGDKTKLFEYDETEDIVDVFVYRDPDCPYPYTITNTRSRSIQTENNGFGATSTVDNKLNIHL